MQTARVRGAAELAELIFRTRGQTYSIAVSELEPRRFTLSTAYEVPEPVRGATPIREALADLADDYPGTRFTLARGEDMFVASLEFEAETVEAFLESFWQLVSRLRESGGGVIARMVDRSESRAAADKFIRQFMKGER